MSAFVSAYVVVVVVYKDVAWIDCTLWFIRRFFKNFLIINLNLISSTLISGLTQRLVIWTNYNLPCLTNLSFEFFSSAVVQEIYFDNFTIFSQLHVSPLWNVQDPSFEQILILYQEPEMFWLKLAPKFFRER